MIHRDQLQINIITIRRKTKKIKKLVLSKKSLKVTDQRMGRGNIVKKLGDYKYASAQNTGVSVDYLVSLTRTQ